jgi:type III secretion system YopN/LcrE/InvE/MxiC family regulator
MWIVKMEISRPSFASTGFHKPRHEAVKRDDAQVQMQASEVQPEEDLSPAALLQRFVNSTDEMSAAMAQFRNRRDLKKVDASNDHFERVLDDDVMPKVLQVLKAAQSQGVPAELLAQLRNLFPDDSDLLLVLRELLRRRQMDGLSRKRLEKAKEEVETNAAPRRLKAGINCAIKARLFGKLLQREAPLLRESYRQFLEDTQTEVQTYEEWIGSYGYEHREQVLNFIEESLTTDVMSHDPSCSSTEFGGLLKKLTQLKLLRSADSLFVGQLLRYPLVRAHNDSEAEWLVFLLAILQAPEEIDQSLYEVLGEAMLLTVHADRASLLQLIRQACHSLPLELFRDVEEVHALLERFNELAETTHKRELIERRRGI